MRRGHKTTELGVTAAVIIGNLTSALGGGLSPHWAALAAAIAAGAYAISRGLVKAGGAEAFPALVANERPATHGHN